MAVGLSTTRGASGNRPSASRRESAWKKRAPWRHVAGEGGRSMHKTVREGGGGRKKGKRGGRPTVDVRSACILSCTAYRSANGSCCRGPGWLQVSRTGREGGTADGRMGQLNATEEEALELRGRNACWHKRGRLGCKWMPARQACVRAQWSVCGGTSCNDRQEQLLCSKGVAGKLPASAAGSPSPIPFPGASHVATQPFALAHTHRARTPTPGQGVAAQPLARAPTPHAPHLAKVRVERGLVLGPVHAAVAAERGISGERPRVFVDIAVLAALASALLAGRARHVLGRLRRAGRLGRAARRLAQPC
eukprot:354502-Chlamydomonas_euryale.AAC.3